MKVTDRIKRKSTIKEKTLKTTKEIQKFSPVL